MKFTKTLMVDFELTPSDLAEAWCGMNSDEQAEFFNTVATLSRDWNAPLQEQLGYLSDSPVLNDAGRNAMYMIGEYSSKAPSV